jgi:PII-like signaling protein
MVMSQLIFGSDFFQTMSQYSHQFPCPWKLHKGYQMGHAWAVAHCNILWWSHTKEMDQCSSSSGLVQMVMSQLIFGSDFFQTKSQFSHQLCPRKMRQGYQMGHAWAEVHWNIVWWSRAKEMEQCSSSGLVQMVMLQLTFGSDFFQKKLHQDYQMGHAWAVAHCNIVWWSHTKEMEQCSSSSGLIQMVMSQLTFGSDFSQTKSKFSHHQNRLQNLHQGYQMGHAWAEAHCNILWWSHAKEMEQCSSSGLVQMVMSQLTFGSDFFQTKS